VILERMSIDLFSWREYIKDEAPVIAPWKPRALAHEQWPPFYKAVYAWRMKTLDAMRANPELLAGAKLYYRDRAADFVMHWVDTYDPRMKDALKWVPFVFFKRQEEYFEFLNDCASQSESGLVEKCRDAGVTWGSCAWSVHSWLFRDNDAIGWGSRKEVLVDKLGDPDSIFEKMRLIIRRLPDVFRPAGFNPKEHATFMKLVNPENGSIIAGEAGDNIGRGGRKRIYFKDESAHYSRPELIEAALGDNTNVQIDISSVNGIGNVFHRRREAGKVWFPGVELEPGFTRVFIFEWQQHPAKTQEWYDQRRAKYEREGMLHLFNQEVDRDYSGAISNTIIPAEWIRAARDAHKRIPILKDMSGQHMAGFDVADEGVDRNALALREAVIVRHVEEWGERDPGTSARRAMAFLRAFPAIRCQYDSIGIGSNVKSEFNRLRDIISKSDDPNKMKQLENFPKMVPWNAGAAVLNPYERIIPDDRDSLCNRDFFYNIKAQAWWSIRARFYKVFQCIEALNNGENVPNYRADELISLDGSMPLIAQLEAELSQATRGENSQLKMIVNKKPDGTKSPNLADAVVMMFFPIPEDYSKVLVGSQQ
jgi:phage terminase large subunit